MESDRKAVELATLLVTSACAYCGSVVTVVEMIVEVMVTITSRRDEGDGICTFDTDVVGMLKAEHPDPKTHDNNKRRAICANSGMSRRRCTELLFVMMFADVRHVACFATVRTIPLFGRWPSNWESFSGSSSPPPQNFCSSKLSSCCGGPTAASRRNRWAVAFLPKHNH